MMLGHRFLCLTGLSGGLSGGLSDALTARFTLPARFVLPLLASLAGVSSAAAEEQRFAAYITGYGFWDNTPPGTAIISHPVKHRRAGGSGTHDDPVTLAVGHALHGPHEILDFPPGTMLYLPRIKKYAVVEDTCGDGPRPQDGPCHTGARGHIWLDLYVGGQTVTPAQAEQCQYRITAVQMVYRNPAPHYEVHPGEVIGSGCAVF